MLDEYVAASELLDTDQFAGYEEQDGELRRDHKRYLWTTIGGRF